MRRLTAASLIVAATLAAPAAATQPISPFDPATWTKSQLAMGYKFGNPYGYFYNYGMLGGQVSIRGPESALTARPKVGERFYVRTAVVWFTHPWFYIDTYKTSVILPEGVTPSITAADDVICAVTNTDDSTVRIPGPSECQDPVQMGASWEFPAVSLDEGQVAQFWFPVVSSRTYNGEAGIQLSGRAVLNPGTVLPNPVVAEVPLYVDPAAAAPPSVPSASAPGTLAPSTPTSPLTTSVTSLAALAAPNAIGISWKPSTTPGVTGYRIQVRRKGTTRWITVGTAAKSARTFRWRKARRGSTYFVRVAPIAGGVVGAWSKPVRVTAR